MAEKKRFEATAELFLKTSNASKDAKKFADGIRQQLSNIENAADNFTVFQDLVGYIAQANKNLAALIKNHKDEFKDMVSGLDEGLHNQYEEMFGVSGETLQKLDVLREKLTAIKKGAKPEEVRKFVTELNGLFTAVGSDMKLDPSEFKQKITQDMVDKVTVAFGNFEKIIVDKVSNLKNNLNLGGIGIGSFSEDVQKELKGLSDQLSEAKSLKKELESTLSAINKSENGNKVALDTKPTEESVKKLIEQYNALEEASKNLTNGTNEYYSNLTKRANIGMQLYAIKERGLEFKDVNIDSIVNSEAFSKVQDELKSKSQEIFANLDQIIQTTQQKVQDFMTSLSSGSGQGGTSTDQDVAIKKDTEETVKILEDCKNKLTNALQDYYNAVEKARGQGIDTDAGEVSAEMESVRNQIEQMLDNWGIDKLDKLIDGRTWNVKELIMNDVLDDIAYQEIRPDEIEGKINDMLSGLQIDIPNSAKQASSATTSAFAKITEGAKQADEAVQNVMYHLGNLLNGKGQSHDTFGDMAENLTKAVQGNTKYEQYGFGVLGGGLFGVVDPSVIDHGLGKSNFIQSIDISKYNMYMADTEERVTALMDFLSKLQKFSMKFAEPNYTGFDSYLQNVTTDSLYDQFKVIFEQSDLTKEQFLAFINEMVSLLKQAGLAFDSETGVLDFTNISKEMANSENISTRFMKMLGFEGVNTGTTSFGGFGQGSVLFDFKESDIVGYFDSVNAAVQDYEKIIQQANDGTAWTGTTEQLQQYASNIDSIIDRITQYKNSGILKDASTLDGLDETLSKLIQIRENINDILSGKNISGNGSQDTSAKVTVPSANSDNATKIVPIGDAINSADVTTETAQLQGLLGILNQVTKAVNAKTTAFAQEYVVVNEAVQREIDALNRLKESLMTIQSLIQSIFNGNIAITGDVETKDGSARTNTMSTSLSTIEKTLSSIYGVLQGFTGIQAENENSVQYKGTSPERQAGVQSLNDAANTLNNAASNIIEMIQGSDGVWRAASSSEGPSNNAMQLADTAQQTENNLIELGNAAQNTSNYLDSVSGGSGGGSSNDDSNGGASSSDGGYALENTLQQTNSILNRIASGSGGSGGTSRGGTSKTTYGTGAITMAEAKNNALWKTLNSNNGKLLQSGKIATAVQAYRDAFEELKKQYTDLQNSKDPTEQQKEGFIEARTNCSNLRQEVERLVKSYNTATTAAKVIDFEPLKNFDNRENELREYVQKKFPTAEIGDFNAAYTQLSFTIKNADGSFTNAKASINSMGTAITTTAGEAQKSVSLIGSVIDGFKGKWQQLGSYLSSIFSWRALASQVKQGVAYVREIDSALTELKKVTDETSATYEKFLQTMSKTASQTGSTVKDLTSSAADWARLGYSLEESGELAATTAKLLNVSEFTSVEDATSALVSSLQAFTTEGQDVGQRAEEIVDVLNNIGNRYPVATNELAQGLASSGAALVAANNSIEEQVAMLAAGNAIIQDVSSVASGLKIVAARLRGTTADGDDDTDSAITNVSKLQEKIKALTKEANGGKGINIIDESGSYKSTYEILSEIAAVWDKMDDLSQASLLELIAGGRFCPLRIVIYVKVHV